MISVTERARALSLSLTKRDGYRLAYLVLAIAAIVMGVSVTLSHSGAFSPFDEWMYFDYLVKFPTQGFIHSGEPIGDVAMNWMACHGLQAFGVPSAVLNTCNVTPIDHSLFPFAGMQSAQLYTPLFFAPTWAIASLIQAITGLGLLEAARLVGTLMLVGTVIAVAAVMRTFRVPATAAIAIGLLFIASPFTWWTYTFISTDSPGVLIGAISVLAIERLSRGRLNGWWFVPLFTFALLIKAVNAISIGIVFIYAVVYFFTNYRGKRVARDQKNWSAALTGRGPIALFLSPLVGAFVALTAQLMWLRFVAASAVGPPAQVDQGRGITIQDVIGQMWAYVPDIFSTGTFEMGALSRALLPVVVVGVLLGWLCLGGVIGSVWSNTLTSERRVPAVATLIASVLAGPALAIMFASSIGHYVDLGARYGSNLVSLILLSTAFIVSGKRQRVVTLWIAIALFVYMFVTTFFPTVT